MGSRHSGNNIVMVRVYGGVPEHPPDGYLTVNDNYAWVDLGFREFPGGDIRKLFLNAGGELVECKDPPTGSLIWSRWYLWPPKRSDERRRGEFAVGGGDTGLPLVRAYVEPQRIFSTDEHQRMVQDITQALDGATWETRETIPGVHIRKIPGQETIAQTIANLREELRDAMSIGRHPAFELAPIRPGEKSLIGASDLTYTTDLPENHIVGWWATYRLRMLQNVTAEIAAQLTRQSRELHRIDPSLAEERAKTVGESVGELQRLLDVIDALRRRVAPLARPESPDFRLIGPAVTRDPRRRRLLDALRRSAEVSTIEVTALLSRFRERIFAELFEVWGAAALVSVIQSLNWTMNESPRIRWIDTWSPERIVWSFSRGDERLDLIYEPHAERQHLGPQEITGPLLNRIQRAAASMDPAGESRFLAIDSDASPDYALVFHSDKGTAFTIGDASATDFEYAQKNRNNGKEWKLLIEKIHKLAEKYSRSLGWWSKNKVFTCSTPASFVLVPGEEAVWLAEPAISNEIDKRNVLLLGGLPQNPGNGDPIPRERLDRIIDTLRAHATDGSHRLPVVPGLHCDSPNESSKLIPAQ